MINFASKYENFLTSWLCILLIFVFPGIIFSQSSGNFPICEHGLIHQRAVDSKFVTRPPEISSFILTKDRTEKIQVAIKEEYAGNSIRIRFHQNWIENGENKYDIRVYDLYDDGQTSGDLAAGDLIFTNNQIDLFLSKGIQNWEIFTVDIWIDLLEGETMINRNKFKTFYIHTTPEFHASLPHPEFSSMHRDSSLLATDRFIYTDNYSIKYQLDNAATYDHTGDFWEFEDIDSFLLNYWSENHLGINRKNFNIRTEVPLITYNEEPTTGKIHISLPNLMNTTFLSLNHEILHQWIPVFYYELGDLFFNLQDRSHHPVIFRNTSGFLGPTEKRIFNILCEDHFTIPGRDTTYIDFLYQPCSSYSPRPGKISDTHTFNDLELFIMGLLPADSIQFPLYFLKDTIRTESLGDTAIRIYYREENILPISKQTLVEERNKMMEFENMITGDSLNLIMNFVGNRMPTQDEIAFLYFLSEDISRKGSLSKDDVSTSLTYYEATRGKGFISTRTTRPSCLDGVELSVEMINPPSCFNGEDGKARLNISGIADSLVEVIWDNQTTGIENNKLSPGVHEVYIKSVNQCDVTLRYEIPEAEGMNLSIEIEEDTLSTASVTVTGGTPPYSYLWNDPAQQTTQVAIGLKAGRYAVIVTDSLGCVSTTSLAVSTTTGSVDQELKKDISIFPNPATNQVTISLAPIHRFNSLELLDLSGKILTRKELINHVNWTVDLSRYDNGIHFIRAKTDTSEISIPLVILD